MNQAVLVSVCPSPVNSAPQRALTIHNLFIKFFPSETLNNIQ